MRAIARFLDVSERRVRQLRDEKVIAEVRPGLYDLIDTNHRYINYLRKRNPEGDETIDYNTERAKLVRAKRKNEEYELQLKENQLHAAEDIEAVMTDMLVNFKSRLMAIPSKLAPVLCKKTDKAEIFALLKDHIDEALMELSDFKATFGERVKEDEKSGSKDSYLALFKQKYVWLFFLGIFCYVSTEQGTSIFMSTFLEQYHGVNPQTEGAQAVSYFWGLMTAGCLVGMILLKLIDSKRLLQISGILTIILLLSALFGSKEVSMIAFPAVGFSISMMYSIVFSLALNSASQHHGSFAGILCSAIVGGAGGPMIVSTLADATSLRTGMLFILVFVGYITFIGFWARPLINNKTIRLKELFKQR